MQQKNKGTKSKTCPKKPETNAEMWWYFKTKKTPKMTILTQNSQACSWLATVHINLRDGGGGGKQAGECLQKEEAWVSKKLLNAFVFILIQIKAIHMTLHIIKVIIPSTHSCLEEAGLSMHVKERICILMTCSTLLCIVLIWCQTENFESFSFTEKATKPPKNRKGRSLSTIACSFLTGRSMQLQISCIRVPRVSCPVSSVHAIAGKDSVFLFFCSFGFVTFSNLLLSFRLVDMFCTYNPP